MTLIHEIAHYYTYKENKFAKPHGIKWKTMFKNISKPFLNNSIFPENLLNSLQEHMKNPKSSFSYDSKVSKELDKYDDENDDLVYLDELPINSVFKYRGKRFIKIEKKRKRYLCECLTNKRNYSVERLSQSQNQTHSVSTYYSLHSKNVCRGLTQIN